MPAKTFDSTRRRTGTQQGVASIIGLLVIVAVILPARAASALAGDGIFTVTNSTVPNFPIWARETGYRMVAGDFNGDGK
ncbi:hypothetical protein, partial [Streptosporangium roseum]|uniref:hypothetical protein n=1 Tax=Streptosporangium roseum TaxID=2001 RepID=UPI003331891E